MVLTSRVWAVTWVELAWSRTVTGKRATNLCLERRSVFDKSRFGIEVFDVGKSSARQYSELSARAAKLAAARSVLNLRCKDTTQTRSEADYQSGRCLNAVVSGNERTTHNIVDDETASQHTRETAIDACSQR